VYDPGAVTVEEMEKLLSKSGTYIKTITQPGQADMTIEKQE
jgi:hypothetical protein